MGAEDFILAIDGGGSKTAAGLFDLGGREIAHCIAPPCNLYQDMEGGLAAIETAWRDICGQAGLDADADRATTRLSAGLAGCSEPEMQQHVRTAFSAFASRRLSSDGFIALIGAFDGAPGALIAVGTGVVGHRLDPTGVSRMIGGWGFPIGDKGGGAWLGFRLLSDYLDHLDGILDRAAGPALWPVLESRLGRDRAGLLDWFRQARSTDFATFAPIVVQAGEAGDSHAATLLDEASTHVIRLAAALSPTAQVRLCVSGGLADVFGPRIAAAVGSGVVDLDRKPAPLRGAYLIGTDAVAPDLSTD